MNIFRLLNTVQDYAWGSPSAIPLLLGKSNPNNKPQAELWMGAHPKAPSRVFFGGRWISLPEMIDCDPQAVLGSTVVEKLGPRFPLLFKVLAAEKSLSIQAHPNLDQAREGFNRENSIGIPIDAPHRNYRDQNHKPEIICALSPFWAMRGFRRYAEIIEEFTGLNLKSSSLGLDAFIKNPDRSGLTVFFNDLMSLEEKQKKSLVGKAVKAAAGRKESRYEWVTRLNREHPGDIGVLSPLLLNLVHLKPGEAIFIDAGELHAYLQGVGIELMANSDNVLRGGLTVKHVDVPELIKTLTFSDKTVDIILPERSGAGEEIYRSSAREFLLSRFILSGSESFRRHNNDSFEILIITEGDALISCPDSGEKLSIKKGDSLFIAASACIYTLSGSGVVYKASVPV